MIKLSAAIITFNEENNIGRCLASLAGIADEIVVVDSGSTDNTEEICKKFHVTFIRHAFEGHIQQKNFAAGKCTHDYILSLDADEALSDRLKESVAALKSSWEKDGYMFNRLTNYCGKWIHHCGWYPDRKLRLFRKGKGKWAGLNPHDRFILNNPSNCGKIKGDLLHYSYYSIKDHLLQAEKFSLIAAGSLLDAGKSTSFLMMYVNAAVRFVRDYFFRLGILDGYYGFIICRISSKATFLKYKKLHELRKAGKKP